MFSIWRARGAETWPTGLYAVACGISSVTHSVSLSPDHAILVLWEPIFSKPESIGKLEDYQNHGAISVNSVMVYDLLPRLSPSLRSSTWRRLQRRPTGLWSQAPILHIFPSGKTSHVHTITQQHGFLPQKPSLDICLGSLSWLIPLPLYHGWAYRGVFVLHCVSAVHIARL